MMTPRSERIQFGIARILREWGAAFGISEHGRVLASLPACASEASKALVRPVVIAMVGVCAALAAALVGCGHDMDSPQDAPDMSGPLFQARAVLEADDRAPADDIVGRKHDGEKAKTYRVSKEVIIDDSDVVSGRVFQAPGAQGPVVMLQLNEDAAKRLDAAIVTMIGRKMAIVAGGEVLAAPTIQGTVKGRPQIEGFAPDEAAEFLKKLNARAKYRKAHPNGETGTPGS
jgi:preprotein translocase subunit SecD